MAQTLYWYDLETFGRWPLVDRIAQFAGLRTDDSFNPIGDPLVLYCKITPDYLPSPKACTITGITPQHTLEEGLNEYDFISRIRQEMLVPGTTVVGFNNIRFDDEFIRNCLYRNFYDPYEREWAGGNSRWDVLDLLRAARDLRPEGITWPERDGKPSFRLEEFTQANGIAHEAAHDALSDVRATISAAKLVHDKHPKLFRYYFSHRKKEDQRRLVDLNKITPLLHTAGSYTRPEGCTTLVAPVGIDPQIRNNLIALDLRYDPTPLLDLEVEEIRRRIFTSRAELEAEQEFFAQFGEPADQDSPGAVGVVQEGFSGRIPLVSIGLNKAPYLAPLSTLPSGGADRLGLDLARCNHHLEILRNHPRLIQKIATVFTRDENRPRPRTDDPDFAIYSGGFFKDEDKALFEEIHKTLAEEDPAEARPKLLGLQFLDTRISQMLRRFFARNYPETLGPKDQERWNSFCASRLLYPPLSEATDLAGFSKQLVQMMESSETPARDKIVLKALADYKEQVKTQVLAYSSERVENQA